MRSWTPKKKTRVAVRRAVYLDSTILNYLFDARASLQTYVEITQRWWEEERQHFDLWVSEETIAEVSIGEYPNRDYRVRVAHGCPCSPSVHS